MSNKKSTRRPACVGFIMDGNRRWARAQELTPLEGHVAGEQVFIDSVEWVREQGIEHAVYYAFSTENWYRSEQEVAWLMQLLEKQLDKILTDLAALSVRVRVIGQRSRLPISLVKRIQAVEVASANYTDMCIWIALSYGGRAEIVAAVNAAVAAGEAVDEATFATYLWSAGMPDPDLIIRTGGEQRLSNFLPWQAVYSELLFTDTYWPAFTNAEFMRMLHIYEQRQRRRGR